MAKECPIQIKISRLNHKQYCRLVEYLNSEKCTIPEQTIESSHYNHIFQLHVKDIEGVPPVYREIIIDIKREQALISDPERKKSKDALEGLCSLLIEEFDLLKQKEKP